MRLPLVLSEADRHLGLANRALASPRPRVCLAFEIAGRERLAVPGHRPPGAGGDHRGRRAPRRASGSAIAAEARCLLVFGGSLGALSINTAALDGLLDPAGRDFHVLHITGRRDHALAREKLAAAGEPERYTLVEWEPGLADALAACDLALARSGGSVFELAAAGVPAILVPYPYASGLHQHANAEWMTEAGAAVTIEDDELSGERCPRASRVDPPRRPPGWSGCRPHLAPWPGRTPPREIAGELLAAIRRGLVIDGRHGGAQPALHRDRRRRDERPGPGLRAARSAVTGSDRSESSYLERLRAAGLDPRVGHDAEAVPEGAEVVISTAIPDDNPELARARERGQRVIHRGELLAELCTMKRLIAVAGTHGKTTTSGMLVHGLRAIGADPAFVLGGELPGRWRGWRPCQRGLGQG